MHGYQANKEKWVHVKVYYSKLHLTLQNWNVWMGKKNSIVIRN